MSNWTSCTRTLRSRRDIENVDKQSVQLIVLVSMLPTMPGILKLVRYSDGEMRPIVETAVPALKVVDLGSAGVSLSRVGISGLTVRLRGGMGDDEEALVSGLAVRLRGGMGDDEEAAAPGTEVQSTQLVAAPRARPSQDGCVAMATVPSGSRAPAPPADTSGQRVVYDTVAKTWRIEQPADGTVQLRKNMLSGHILYMMGDVDGNRNDFCSGRYNRRDELIGGAPSYIHNKCSDLLIWYVPQHKNWNIGPRRGVIDGKCWMWSSNDPTAQHVTKVDWYRAADRKKIGLRLYSDPTDTQVARSAMDRKSRGELKPDTRDGNPGKRVEAGHARRQPGQESTVPEERLRQDFRVAQQALSAHPSRARVLATASATAVQNCRPGVLHPLRPATECPAPEWSVRSSSDAAASAPTTTSASAATAATAAAAAASAAASTTARGALRTVSLDVGEARIQTPEARPRQPPSATANGTRPIARQGETAAANCCGIDDARAPSH